MQLARICCLAAGLAVGASAASYGAHIRFKQYPIPLPASDPKPGYITTGPDGALWYTEHGDTEGIGTVTTSGVFKQFSFPLGTNFNPAGIVAGTDGALWFGENGGIGRITPAGSITRYAVHGSGQGIVAGPDGALWFVLCTASDAGEIGRITTAGDVTLTPMPSGTCVGDIAVGPDGALWFTVGNGIGRITTGGVITNVYTLKLQRLPEDIVTGSDGALWFTEAEGVVGRITATGQITEYRSHGAIAVGGAIAAGPDGALWFAVPDAGQIGRITTSGTITMYTFPSDTVEPIGITAGPDGGMWITGDNFSEAPDLIARLPACGLGLRAAFTSGTLTVKFDLGINRVAVWTLDAGNGYGFTKRIRSTTPSKQFTFTYNNYPSVGRIRIKSKLTDKRGRVYCSEYATVNTKR